MKRKDMYSTVHVHFSINIKRFLGYRKGPDGMAEVVPEEAAIVRDIYALFLGGMTLIGIAKRLMASGVKSPGVKERWGMPAVRSILTNEKYKAAQEEIANLESRIRDAAARRARAKAFADAYRRSGETISE